VVAFLFQALHFLTGWCLQSEFSPNRAKFGKNCVTSDPEAEEKTEYGVRKYNNFACSMTLYLEMAMSMDTELQSRESPFPFLLLLCLIRATNYQCRHSGSAIRGGEG
jgi:hypothetical protein